MPYEKLTAELLQAREQREIRRVATSRNVDRTLIQLSLNIPGADKLPPGAEKLFGWGLRQVLELLPLVESCSHGNDRLGPWALLGTGEPAERLKRQTVELEAATPAARLLDIDIYDPHGRQVGRRELGLPARNCLLCAQPAVVCMRQQQHSEKELQARVRSLLRPFRT